MKAYQGKGTAHATSHIVLTVVNLAAAWLT
jgi:hypothetical protein